MESYDNLKKQRDDIVREKARKAVDKIVFDLSDRKGLDNEWSALDDDVKDEIVDAWTAIVAEAVG